MSQEMDSVPAIKKTAFCCPHCNAFTTQFWSMLYEEQYPESGRIPNIPGPSFKKNLENDIKINAEVREHLLEWLDKMTAGKPFLEVEENSCYSKQRLMNLNISQCYNCKEITVWVHDQIVYPSTKVEILPNQDLPPHIKRLFEEAREIVGLSPKGAAALLRLSIQHLCKKLGASGKDIDQNIGSLVSKGLNPIVQKALDVVRVVGNEAVHPGKIDLDDNRDTALQLFNLVNLIADQMITHPKQVKELYGNLPADKLKGIEQRNKKALENKENT